MTLIDELVAKHNALFDAYDSPDSHDTIEEMLRSALEEMLERCAQVAEQRVYGLRLGEQVALKDAATGIFGVRRDHANLTQRVEKLEQQSGQGSRP